MNFLFSNLPPVRTTYPTFIDTFYSLIPMSSQIDIAVGYVTADSLAELHQAIIYNNNIATLNLVIGMHYLDKFTKLQYNAALALNKFLLNEKRGEVRLVTTFRFHGKMYLFSNNNGPFAGIIGSNNLGSIVGNMTRTYEASTLLNEPESAIKLREFISTLTADATDNISDCTIVDFDKRNTLLEDHENVTMIMPDELLNIKSSLTPTQFEIPLIKNGEVPLKSNLNVFFGKGRLITATGVIQPRHWYETEIIVPKSITQQSGYPKKDSPSAVFDVITDDGWKFSCKVSGDFSKNLRSEDDLKILGKWIKGRLENSGALEVGQLVTPETFNKYGRNSFTLTMTNKHNLWYLDFGVHR
ncbi:MAG: restriction endonuclease PLD domain-containing protein [Anaerofustis sp.]